MKIIQVPIDQIRPDTNQPRKNFNQSLLEELAQNIKQEGIINAIEIDKDNVIITGERRWRAAKLIGLETVPCVVKDITGKERFKHQLAENIHTNTMTDMDSARALQKLLKLYNIVSPGETNRGRPDQGVRWLAEETGKSSGYISEKLSLLDQSEDFQKAVRDERIPATMVRAINACPPEHKEEFTKKILDGDLETRDGAIAVATHLKWDRDNKDILKKSYKGKSTADIVTELREEAPTPQQQASKEMDKALYYKHIIKLAREIKNRMADRTISMYSDWGQQSLSSELTRLRDDIDLFLDDQMVSKIIDL